MNDIIQMISGYEHYILIGLLIMIIILSIVVFILLRAVNKIETRYRKFMRGVNNKNLEELIISYLDKVDEVKSDSKKLKEIYNNLDNRVKNCVQKMSIIRYRAFEDVGSDLSFSIALLDDNNDGAIITGIFGRHESTTYAKPIDKGISRYDLSEEEQQVLEDAMNKKSVK
ncbi:DUF4446 family protein [Clostridium sp. SYSU_GA19001]|uniref:DUF4446 family protein n=1 Tax=Clostridium caldaquaticum TaxID=2940653 RepID=UPI002076FA84|nr:DUF4446 family protein [Clostridium caldaquaticum]MCM8711936.1 DUF4446 family protein [Clostridium caldaquaticum]